MLRNFVKRNSAQIKTIVLFLLSGLILNIVLLVLIGGTKADTSDYRAIVINEVSVQSNPGKDWIELRNTKAGSFSLIGWKIVSREGVVFFSNIAQDEEGRFTDFELKGLKTLYLASANSFSDEWDQIMLLKEGDDTVEADRIRYTFDSSNEETLGITVKDINEAVVINNGNIENGLTFGRKSISANSWCVFEKPTRSTPNTSACYGEVIPSPSMTALPTLPITMTPTIIPTIEITIVPTATVVPRVLVTPVDIQPSPSVPTQMSTPTPSIKVPNPSVIAPFKQSNNTYKGDVYTRMTPTPIPTITVEPTPEITTEAVTDNGLDIELKAGQRHSIVNNSTVCEVFESLTFTARNEVKGRITFSNIDKSDYLNKPYDNKNLFFGLCEFQLQGFTVNQVDAVVLRVKYDQVWLQNNKFTIDQLKLYYSDDSATSLKQKADIELVAERKAEEKKYDVLEAKLDRIPRSFTIAPDGVDEIVKKENSSLPWVLILVGAGLLALVLIIVLLPKKTQDTEAE